MDWVPVQQIEHTRTQEKITTTAMRSFWEAKAAPHFVYGFLAERDF